MAQEHDVAGVEELPPGSRKLCAVGRLEIGVFNVGGMLYALPNLCPHQGGPLCEGRLSGTLLRRRERGWTLEWVDDPEVLICPWHLLEFHLPTGGLDPYVGGGAGWEFLNVQAYDYTRGYAYSADYDGFGYQVFGGVRLPIGGRAKLSGEMFWNGATVDREFFDPYSGFYIEENIKVDGFGGRGGLAFAF